MCAPQELNARVDKLEDELERNYLGLAHESDL